ncbi:MAG: DUF4339 domain-containing protein [Planctomycetia bacterium]|nr:DUF4339 domain-containing protein [Planctomycetia bacterium]
MPKSDKAEWFYSKEGNQLGPVSEGQIQELLRTNAITRNTLVWKKGMNEWAKLANCNELSIDSFAQVAIQMENEVTRQAAWLWSFDGRPWLIALAPLLVVFVVNFLILNVVGLIHYQLMILFDAIFVYGLLYYDRMMLIKEGHSTNILDKYLFFIIVLGPIGYLYARSRQFGFQQKHWIVSIAIVTLFVLLSSTMTGFNFGHYSFASIGSSSNYTREQFRQLIVGKSVEKVKTLLGKPSLTQDLSPFVFWYYENITYDPVSGKRDFQVQLSIKHGMVESVNFLF